MDNVGSLEYLEEIVERLLTSMKSLKQDNLVLQARVESRDQELASLKDQLDSLQGERGQIQKRITGLIESIEKWEKLNESNNEDAAGSSGTKIEEKTLF